MNQGTIRRAVALALAAVVVTVAAACGGTADDPENGADSTSSNSTSTPQPSGTSTDLPDDALIVEVTLEGDSVTPNAERIDAELGQTIVFRVTSDITTSIHGHATPEFHWDVEPGTTDFELRYDEPVNVTIELHDPARTLVQLVVQ